MSVPHLTTALTGPLLDLERSMFAALFYSVEVSK